MITEGEAAILLETTRRTFRNQSQSKQRSTLVIYECGYKIHSKINFAGSRGNSYRSSYRRKSSGRSYGSYHRYGRSVEDHELFETTNDLFAQAELQDSGHNFLQISLLKTFYLKTPLLIIK